MGFEQQLARATASLKSLGARVSVVQRGDRLSLQATLPHKPGKGEGQRQQQISLGLPADAFGLREAQRLALQLAEERDSGTFTWGNWLQPGENRKSSASASRSATGGITCAEAIEQLKAQFWAGRTRSSAAERTWDRIASELRRLPAQATLSTELLVAVAATTEAGSRTRLEACKVFKRLAKLAGLGGLEQLDALRGSYEPAARELPGDEELFAFVREHRAERWGWATAALVVFGCRPSEVFSLQPQADGTCSVLSIKRHNKLPTWRTGLALPKGLVEELGLLEVDLPMRHRSPAEYDSGEAKKATERWQKWLRRQGASWPLYAARHAWAIRSIKKGLPTGLAARAMGHSVAIHCSTYHQAMTAADMAAAAAALG